MRKRSKYKPKPINTAAHLVAIQGACKLDRSDAIRFSMRVQDAVNLISKGQADKQHWQEIFSAINIMEALVIMGKAKDEGGAIEQMQTAVIDVLDRTKKTGTKALYPHELATLRDIVAAYTDLLCEVTHSELFEASDMSKKRILRALQGKDPEAKIVSV